MQRKLSEYWVCQDLANMKKVINLRLMTNHDVAGSEAEESASSIMMTNVPYLNIN